MNKTKLITISALTLTLLLSGCGKVPKLKNGEDAVLSYKGNEISVDTLYTNMKEKYAVTTLVDMFDRTVLSEKYKTDDTETKALEKQLTQYEDYYKQYYTSQYSSFNEFLNANFGTYDQEKIKELMSLDYKRNLVAVDYSESLVSDNEIESYYNTDTKGDIKASHILIKPKTDDDMKDDEKQEAEDAAKTKAEEVISKLNEGKKFADLAKEYSDDDTVDLGWFNSGDMVEEFEDAAYKLEKNKYTTEPVKTQYGYHVILKTGEKAKPKLAKVKKEIIKKLGSEKLSSDKSLYYTALKEMREDYKFKIQDNTLKRLYESYVDNQIANAKKSNTETTSE